MAYLYGQRADDFGDTYLGPFTNKTNGNTPNAGITSTGEQPVGTSTPQQPVKPAPVVTAPQTGNAVEVPATQTTTTTTATTTPTTGVQSTTETAPANSAKFDFSNFSKEDLLKGILGYKWSYENGQSKNTTDFTLNYDYAQPYYEALKGMDPSLANAVQGMNYAQLNDYINTGNLPAIAQPAVPAPVKPRTIWDVATDIVGYKQGYEGGKAAGITGYANNEALAADYYNELEGMGAEGKALAAYLRGSNADEAEAYIAKNRPVPQMTPSEMFSGNNDAFKDYGNVYQNDMHTMYFDPKYGSWVSDYFMTYGNAKGAQAEAGAAAENGGNLDSYARFNKDATNLGYAIAGQDAIQKMRGGYAKGSTDFFNSWSGALNDSARDFSEYEYNNNELAANERVATSEHDVRRYEADQDLKGTEAQANADIYGYDKAAEAEKYVAGLQYPKQTTVTGVGGVSPVGTFIGGTQAGSTQSAGGGQGKNGGSGTGGGSAEIPAPEVGEGGSNVMDRSTYSKYYNIGAWYEDGKITREGLKDYGIPDVALETYLNLRDRSATEEEYSNEAAIMFPKNQEAAYALLALAGLDYGVAAEFYK